MHINIAKINFKPIGINIAKVDFGLYDVAEPRLDGLYITPAGGSAIIVTPNSNYYDLHGKYPKYSFDGKKWKNWTGSVSVQPGQKMYVKGEDYYVWTSSTFGKLFTSTSYYNVGGDISSLTNFEISYYSNAFQGLFMNDKYVRDAGNLILPATSLSPYYYSNMFNGCSGLTAAPALPATRLAQWCYASMFYGCSSLKTAPALPATTLVDYCYSGMFRGCRVLTAAPALPATTLTQQCYMNMFNGCSALTAAPALPATTLANYCYNSMFNGCSKLNSITMLATDISATNCLNNWVKGVASTGTFTKAASMTTLPTGANGIPEGWTVKDYGAVEPQFNGLYITPADASAISVTPNSSYYALHGKYLKYSFDGNTWNDWNGSVTIEPEQKMYLKGEDDYVWNSSTNDKLITSSGYYNVGGDISSLTNEIAEVKEHTFRNLFNGDSYIKDASNLVLPAEKLASYCYLNMFLNCTSLTTTPELPATGLAQYCYSSMFYGCYSLKTAPALPATTLAERCYNFMFENCTSLTTAPELPATTLDKYCYNSMFYGCSKLNSITMLATNISATKCLNNWVSGVSTTGTFTKAASMTTLPKGTSGIPSGWTVVNK